MRKVFYCFVGLLLFFASAGAAKASSIDFGMRVLDPNGQPVTINSDSFNFTFSACPTTAVPHR
jgi:hypothetical protein